MDANRAKLTAVYVAAAVVIIVIIAAAVTGNGKETVTAALNVLAAALQGFK